MSDLRELDFALATIQLEKCLIQVPTGGKPNQTKDNDHVHAKGTVLLPIPGNYLKDLLVFSGSYFSPCPQPENVGDIVKIYKEKEITIRSTRVLFNPATDYKETSRAARFASQDLFTGELQLSE